MYTEADRMLSCKTVTVRLTLATFKTVLTVFLDNNGRTNIIGKTGECEQNAVSSVHTLLSAEKRCRHIKASFRSSIALAQIRQLMERLSPFQIFYNSILKLLSEFFFVVIGWMPYALTIIFNF